MAMFALALVICAVLAWGRFLGASGPPRSLFRLGIESVAVHAVISTIISTALWSVGGFRVVTAQALAAAVPLVLLLRPNLAPWPGRRGARLITRYELVALLLLVLVAPVALPRMHPLYMENDAGVYSSRAIHHLYGGSSIETIPLRDQLSGGLLETFDQDNLLRRVPRGETRRVWTYLPGTYPVEPGGSQFRFQFYPGWPLFMAQFGGVLGLSNMFFAVLFTFTLAVLLFAALLEDRGIGRTTFVTTVALFASSPLLLYFSKYTTAEALLLFLFLFVVYFFSVGTVAGSTLAAAGLAAIVVTHISTFLYAPLLLLLCLEGYRSGDRRVASFAVAAFGLLLGGMALGPYFSPEYFQHIFRASFGRLGMSEPARWGVTSMVAIYAAGLALAVGATWRAARPAPGGGGPPRWYPAHDGRLVLALLRGLMVLLVVYTVYQAYRLGWTDHFLPDGPKGGAWRARSEYAGTGWIALARANIVSMLMATSLVGLPLVLAGAFWRGKKVLAVPRRGFLLAAVLLTLAIYTFMRFDTPSNYCASRYFVPVFVPSVMLLFAEMIEMFRVRRGWIVTLALVGLGFNLAYDRSLYLYQTFSDEMRFVEDVADRVGDNRVLFIRNHKRDNRMAQRLLALPLAHAHDISVVNVVARPHTPVDSLIADYARHLQLRDAAVIARRPPTDGRAFEVVYLMRWYLRQSPLYPYRPSGRRERYYLYNLAFEH